MFMFMAKVNTQLNKQIEAKIDSITSNVREKARKLLTTCNTYGDAVDRLNEYVSSCCDAEIRGISSSLYFELYTQLSESKIFTNPALVSEFYAIDMRNYMNQNCKFQITDKFSYSEKDKKKISIVLGGGIAVVGSVFSVALSLPTGIIPSVIIGGIVAPVTYSFLNSKNVEDYLVDVELYLKDLKSKILEWVDKFIAFYCETIDDLVFKVS